MSTSYVPILKPREEYERRHEEMIIKRCQMIEGNAQ
jgi:hypothetical protein